MLLAHVIFAGLAQGCAYGLVALSFVLIYKSTETFSFAQGEFLMLGAFAGLVLNTVVGLPIYFAIAGAIILMAVLGFALERIVVRPIIGQPVFSMVLLTLGIGYALRGLVTMVPSIGSDTHTLALPYQGFVWKAGGVAIDAAQVAVIGVTAALGGALYALFQYTKIGTAMQAASQNQLAAYYMGIPVSTLNGLVWAIAAAVAAGAGLFIAPMTFVHANMGLIGLKALPAAVIGGFTSMPGAIVGGIIVGLSESLSGYYLPEGLKDIAPYIIVLLVLAIRPNGLFGEASRKKV